MRVLPLCALGLGLAALSTALAFRARAEDERAEESASVEEEQPSRLATLYRHDPLTRAISLATGRPGTVMHLDGVFNRQSDIEYGFPTADSFSVGIEERRDGVIIDLGTQEQLAERHVYRETLGGGQGFATLRLEGDRVIFRNRRVVQGSEALFRPRSPDTASATVHVGHVYLVRLFDRANPGFERVAKMLVVGHQPGDSVTIRWVILRERGAGKG